MILLFLFPLAVLNIYLSPTSDNLSVFIIYQIILPSVCDLFGPVCTSCYIVTSILSPHVHVFSRRVKSSGAVRGLYSSERLGHTAEANRAHEKRSFFYFFAMRKSVDDIQKLRTFTTSKCIPT